MPATLTNPQDYLSCRERYLVALHKYNNYSERFRQLVGASSEAEMEEKLMEPSMRARFLPQIREFAELGRALDSASDTLDLATELQRRKIAQNRAEFDHTIASLDE